MAENDSIMQLDFSEEMKNSYRDYAMSVIISRALPDVRDGLKPVQRRILYAMNELGLDPKKPHRKSARVVGDTMGKYHPHGDSSIYEALVHMTEDYSLQIPLVDGHGNFGSIDGDGAAAMRYTEARLSEGSMSMLDKLGNGLVPFVPNFDNSEEEPVVLPAMLPNLLINGTTGIAVGMATNMPTHNPGEILDGCIAYIDKPSISVSELMKYIPGPDFPTGGIITNAKSLETIYERGEGKIKLRAKTEIENSDGGRKNIVITEIPYTVAGSKTKLVESLTALMRDKVFDEISDVRDESSKEGIRIVIEVKKDRDINNLMNGLYKKTLMEDTYGVNMLAVKDNQPYLFNLKSLIQEFIAFQKDLYTKDFEFQLDKANKRLEIVSGLIRAVDVLDLIIEILRGSSSVKQAKECLIKGITSDIKFKTKASKAAAEKLDFTERQADAILTMPLGRLIGLEILKLHEENDELLETIDKIHTILGSEKELMKVIKQKLKEYRKKFSVERKTELTDTEAENYVEEVKIEDIYVLIDKFGYTKSIDAASFSRMSEDSLKDFIHIIKMQNNDKLCAFTQEGNMYQIKASSLPKCKAKDKGVLIHNLCKLGNENIIFYAPFEDIFETQLMFTTKSGLIKLVSGVEFETVRAVISATKLDDNDSLVSVKMLRSNEALADDMKVVLLTHSGMSIAFPLSEVSEFKKTSKGLKALTLNSKDYVVFADVFSSDIESFNFNNKKILLKKIKIKKRGAAPGKGNIT